MALNCKASTWFEAKIRSEKQMEDGLTKTVKEDYVVDALTFTEAEARILEEASAYYSGAISVEVLKIAAFKEVFFDEDPAADKWYKVKIQMIMFDEKTEKEKRTNINYLVQGASTQAAFKNTEEVMKGSLIDYAIASITETKFLDVVVYGELNESSKEKEETPTEPVSGEDGFEPIDQ